jgi:hypothetical protein
VRPSRDLADRGEPGPRTGTAPVDLDAAERLAGLNPAMIIIDVGA